MRLNIGILAAILTLLSIQAGAQSVRASSGRWFFGGGVGVGFGDLTYIEISPFVGYRVTDAF